MKTIRGKKALVTGAGSGIGRAIAIALAREGAEVCLVGRDETKLAAVAAEVRALGAQATDVPADLASPEQVSAVAKSALASLQQIDILVNCAGVTYYGPTDFMTVEQVDRILATNLLAPVQLTRELMPLFTAQGEAHIVNVSSIFGLVTMRKGAVYQATKFGLVGFSNAIRAEYHRRGVGVSVLCPGFVRTPMLENFAQGMSGRRHTIPDWLSVTPERVAEVTIRTIRRNKALVVVSWPARLMWWMMRLSPGLFDWMMREGWRK